MATPEVNQTFLVYAPRDEVRTRLLAVAGSAGYALVDEIWTGFTLRRRRVPVWAIVLAVVFFPLGLLFLLARTEDVVAVKLDRVSHGTRVTAVGRASRRLQ
jgi:hypothetical protein